jgi:hypothetical protein
MPSREIVFRTPRLFLALPALMIEKRCVQDSLEVSIDSIVVAEQLHDVLLAARPHTGIDEPVVDLDERRCRSTLMILKVAQMSKENLTLPHQWEGSMIRCSFMKCEMEWE